MLCCVVLCCVVFCCVVLWCGVVCCVVSMYCAVLWPDGPGLCLVVICWYLVGLVGVGLVGLLMPGYDWWGLVWVWWGLVMIW